MSLVNALKRTLSINETLQNDLADKKPLSFAKTKKAMLKELVSSQENGFLIGIYSKELGDGMFLVGINQIETDGPSEMIVFETYEQSGMILSRTRVAIDEIKMVCPFNKKYLNPVLYKLHIA
jgi:hypothetical protein